MRLWFGLLILCVVGAVNCDKSPTGASPLKCPVGLSLKPPALTSGAGPGTAVVSAQASCAWAVSADSAWITGLNPTSGQGNGEVQFLVDANSNTGARQGSIIINNVRLTVAQPGGCPVTLSPTKQDVPAASSTGTIAVGAAADCGWSAVSAAPWLTVNSGASGSGNGTVGFSAASNAGAQRSGALTIGDQTFLVTQADVNAPVCTFVILPSAASVNAGGGSVPVTITGDSRCSWSAKTAASWITFDVDSGNGGATIMVDIAPNPGTTSRVGTATIGGVTFTVNQGG